MSSTMKELPHTSSSKHLIPSSKVNEKSAILKSSGSVHGGTFNQQDADETGNGKNPGRNEGGNPILEKERSNSIIKKTPHLSSKGKSKSSISGDKEIESHPPPQQMIENDMSNLVQRDDLDGDGGGSLATSKSSLTHASFNYINSILGSGIIGMPYALHQAGVGLGLILMVFVAYITDYSLVLMVRAGHLSGSFTYPGMMESAFGRWGFYVLSFLQLVYPLIAMISYNIIVGDTLTKVLVYFANDSGEMRYQREVVVLVATIFVTLPLSLYRNVSRLANVSFFSLLSIGVIVISILIRFITDPQPWTSGSWKFANTGVVQACGVFAFAFMCHHNTFMIYSSVENTSELKWQKLTHISIGISLGMSFIFSLAGYATFTGNVQGDLLENYCWNDDLINISRLLFCITILLTLPLETFVVREVIENLWFKEKQPSPTSRHFSLTFFIVITAYVASMSTDCLGIVLELNGVLAAIPLAYVLPAICFIRLDPSKFLSREKLPAIGIAIFGIGVSTIGLFLLILNGQSSQCSHGKSMPYCTIPDIPQTQNQTSTLEFLNQTEN